MSAFISFESAQFNRIFPYSILLDSRRSVLSCGNKVMELFPGITGKPFSDFFTIQSPVVPALDLRTVEIMTGLPVVIGCGSPPELLLRGQVELLAGKTQVLFIGLPWPGHLKQGTCSDPGPEVTAIGILHDPEPIIEIKTENEAVTKSYTLLKNKNILLVEDSDMNRIVARNALSRYGVLVTEATNGAEALDRMKKKHFDLILMDLQMPVMDGLKATKIIRKEMRLDTPIIALTANAGTEMDLSLKAGMNDSIIKPFTESTLLGIILRYLTSEKTNREISRVLTGSTIEPPKKLYNLDYLRKFSRGNPDFVRKMINLFLEQMPASVDEIRVALKKGDTEQVSRTAHRIKPTIDSFGIDDLKQDIRSIEAMAKKGSMSPELVLLVSRLADVIAHVAGELENEQL